MENQRLVKVARDYKYAFCLYHCNGNLGIEDKLYATYKYSDHLISVDLNIALEQYNLLPAYWFSVGESSFLLVIDPESKVIYPYDIFWTSDSSSEEKTKVLKVLSYPMHNHLFYALDTEAAVKLLYKPPTSKEDATNSLCTEDKEPIDISDGFNTYDGYLSLDDFFNLTEEQQLEFIQVFFDEQINEKLEDPVFTPDADDSAHFICGSEEELERLTELAVKVWSPSINRSDISIEYISIDDEEDGRVEIQIGGEPILKNGFLSRASSQAESNFFRLLDLIFEYNSFGNTVWTYNDGTPNRRSGYSEGGIVIAYSYSPHHDPEVMLASPMEIVQAYENLNNWLEGKVAASEIDKYLP
jgi:hypothetical protein